MISFIWNSRTNKINHGLKNTTELPPGIAIDWERAGWNFLEYSISRGIAVR